MVCMLLLIIHSIMLHFVRVNCCIIKMWLQKSGQLAIATANTAVLSKCAWLQKSRQLATANIMANAYSHLCTHVHIYIRVCVCLYVTEGIHVAIGFCLDIIFSII